MKMTLSEIARLTGAQLQGNPDVVIEGAAGLTEATEKDVSFLENPKYAAQVSNSRAGGVFLPPSAKDIQGPFNRLYAEFPKWAYAQVLAIIEKERHRPELMSVVHAKAEVHCEARLGKDVSVGPFSVVQARTIVGDGTRIGAQCYVGYNARIGKNCLLYPQVVIGDYCEVGDRAIIHSGTVIGSDGYGYWTDPKTGEHKKIPQIGRVVVEDNVEIGSNVSIDRATTGETRIGAGTKIDNLVQVAHNVSIGRNCLLVSQVGVAGSTRIGNQVTLAGQVGIVGHLTIGDSAIITAQSGVMSNVEPKSVLFGSPARPHREAMKLEALFSRLPEMYEAIKDLKQRLLGKEKDRVQG